MKYLKIFEEFGEKLYTQMSKDEVEDIFGSRYSDWTDTKRSPKLIELTNREVDRIKGIRYFYLETIYKKSLVCIPHHTEINMVTIYSLGDEWYVIQEESNVNRRDFMRYYKCDTIEGVIQYLNDKNLINNQ
jgi:hypothetical protein